MKLKLSFLLGLAFINIIVFAVGAKADQPLPPPSDYSIRSANGKYKAFFQVKENKTTVYEIDKSSPKKNKIKFWEMDGWFRNTYLSNDGENLIVAYEGANLLSLNYKRDEVMISFYDKGNLLNQVRLNQLIQNPTPEKLEKTVSHYRWVDTYGLNEKQIFEVNTIEKKKFQFDIKTGLPIGMQLHTPSIDSGKVSSTDSTNQNAQTNQTNQANSANSNQANTKNETGGCQAAVLGILSFAVLSSILSSQQQV